MTTLLVRPAAIPVGDLNSDEASFTRARSTVVLVLRRAFVVAGVAVCLAVGVMTIRSAAMWTASSAPLTAAPVSAQQLADQLASERARSAGLEQQLAGLSAQTAQLADALKAAQDRVGTDATSAAELRAKLTAAQRRLAAMIRGGQAGHAPVNGTVPLPLPPTDGEPRDPGDN